MTNPHSTTKNIFLSASYKTCRVFIDFDRVGSAYQTDEIPAQSHTCFGVFFSDIPTNVLKILGCCQTNRSVIISILIFAIRLNRTSIHQAYIKETIR